MSIITDEMVEAAALASINACRKRWQLPPVPDFSSVSQTHRCQEMDNARAALAAVAPLIAKAEREACAKVAERIMITHPRQDGTRPFFSAAAAAAAIRARSTEDTTP